MNADTVIIITLFSVLVVFLFFYLLRTVSSYQRKKMNEQKKESSQVGFVVDTFHGLVSKLKEKERELEALKKDAEERATSIGIYNENIFQSVPSGVVSFDQNLMVTKINSAAEKILAIKGMHLVGGSHREVFGNPISEIIEKRKTVERAEVSYTTQAGKRVWLGLTLSPLKDKNDNIIGQILVFTDLTELKALHAQMELRERLSSLGEMSAGIAHELRNPMAVISGYTKILTKKVDGALLPTVEAISKEVAVMDRIISDFLSFAKPVDPLLTKFDLHELINDCIKALGPIADIIRVSYETGGTLLIRADEVMLRQCITNLLLNAVEAMTDGGDLAIGVAEGDYLEIRISDTGHGIPEGIRDKIFMPFYTTKERGTGLGLSIVHKIVVSHGGSLNVDSSERGTVFRMRFPAEMIAV